MDRLDLNNKTTMTVMFQCNADEARVLSSVFSLLREDCDLFPEEVLDDLLYLKSRFGETYRELDMEDISDRAVQKYRVFFSNEQLSNLDRRKKWHDQD